jgi:glutamate dehydrogenase (NAD(P)+)
MYELAFPPNIPEGLEALEAFKRNFIAGAELMNVRPDVTRRLLLPERVIVRHLTIKMDNGDWGTFAAFRVGVAGFGRPYKGGLRFYPGVSAELFAALAGEMAAKLALAGLAYGGGKGGISVDPRTLSPGELDRLVRAYARAFAEDIGPGKDVPAPDVNTNAETMAVLVDELSTLWGDEAAARATVTGKPVGLGGSPARDAATGRGVFLAMKWALAARGIPLEGRCIGFLGAGNVATWAALFASQARARVVTMTNSKGAFHNPDGIEIASLLEHLSSGKRNRLETFDGVRPIQEAEALAFEYDVLVPAALGGQINVDNADLLRAGFVIEGANGGVTPDADLTLRRKGVEVVPDILANSGGVAESVLGEVERVPDPDESPEDGWGRLETTMERAYRAMVDLASEREVTLRKAAYGIAAARLAALAA